MNKSGKDGEKAKQNRILAGKRIRQYRNSAGLTQMEFAKRVNQNYYSFISQVETGFAKIQYCDIGLWAEALGVSTPVFAADILSFYEPELSDALREVK